MNREQKQFKSLINKQFMKLYVKSSSYQSNTERKDLSSSVVDLSPNRLRFVNDWWNVLEKWLNRNNKRCSDRFCWKLSEIISHKCKRLRHRSRETYNCIMIMGHFEWLHWTNHFGMDRREWRLVWFKRMIDWSVDTDGQTDQSWFFRSTIQNHFVMISICRMFTTRIRCPTIKYV
jgi:hypothetical protein